MTDVATLEERLNRIEAPVVQAAREAELARLRTEAEEAQRALVRIGAELADLGAQRRALAPKITAAEAEWARLRLEDARLAVAETALQRQHGLAWDSIHAAEIAGRPVAPVIPPKRWAGETFERALRKIFGLALTPRHKAPVKAGPALRPGETEGVRVRFAANTTAGGVSRLAGEEGIVTVADADVLVRADKAVVLQTGVVVPPEKPYAIRNVGPVPVAVDGVPLAPGAVAMVTAAAWNDVLGGRYPALAPADGDAQRMAELQRRAAELGVE
jgi:hypothetical protein